MEKKNLVVCISGGLDSFTMFHYANKIANERDAYNIKYLIVIDKDSPYWEKEWNHILRLYKDKNSETLDNRFNVVTLNGYGRLAKTDDHVILGRNAVIASIASAIGENIWIGGTSFENNIGMCDKNVVFFRLMTNTLTQACGYKRLTTIVESPFQGNWVYWDKPDMILWLEQQGIKEWRDTVSCFHPQMPRCGSCPVCYKRYIYEKYVEIKYNIRYSDEYSLEQTYYENPLESKYLKDTIEKMREATELGDFSRYRSRRIEIYSEVLLNQKVISESLIANYNEKSGKNI